MDIQVQENFIENICTVKETVLIINFDDSDDPNSKKEDASLETNPTPEEENIGNDSKEESNEQKYSEASKVADKPQFQQQQMDCASASVSKQCDTQGESKQKLFVARQNPDGKEEMKEAEKDDGKHTKDTPSAKSERKQDSSESDSGDEILHDSEDESDEDSDELDRKMMEIDLACRLVDQVKEEANLPRQDHSDDRLTLEEIEEQILEIELACSRKEACAREESTEPDLIRFHKLLTEHGQGMTPVPRVSVDVQNLVPTETESHDEDPDLSDLNYGRHVSCHSFEPESGRVNPIPRHYYSEDNEQQKGLKGNMKQDTPSRREYQDLHRPKPVSAADHVMTPLRNIHEHDELPVSSATQSKPSSDCEDDKQGSK